MKLTRFLLYVVLSLVFSFVFPMAIYAQATPTNCQNLTVPDSDSWFGNMFGGTDKRVVQAQANCMVQQIQSDSHVLIHSIQQQANQRIQEAQRLADQRIEEIRSDNQKSEHEKQKAIAQIEADRDNYQVDVENARLQAVAAIENKAIVDKQEVISRYGAITRQIEITGEAYFATLYKRNALATGFVLVAILLAAGGACYLFWMGKAQQPQPAQLVVPQRVLLEAGRWHGTPQYDGERGEWNIWTPEGHLATTIRQIEADEAPVIESYAKQLPGG